MQTANYDRVNWTTDLGKTFLFSWVPESAVLNRLPSVYGVSDDNTKLYVRQTGQLLVSYSDHEFKVESSFTDWEFYFYFHQDWGILTIPKDYEIRIGAVVSRGGKGQLALIRGGGSLYYHDSIWAQYHIEIRDITVAGHEDGAHQNPSFIYCGSFKGRNLTVRHINRIHAKWNVDLYHGDINDDDKQEMYIHAGAALTIENSVISVHQMIQGYNVYIRNSQIRVVNAMNENPVFSYGHHMEIFRSELYVERACVHGACKYKPVFSGYKGDLYIGEDARLTIHTEVVPQQNFPCLWLGMGRIYVYGGEMEVTAYKGAVFVDGFGENIVLGADREQKSNCQYLSSSNAAKYRFRVFYLGKQRWIYLKHGELEQVIPSDVPPEYNGKDISASIRDKLFALRCQADAVEHKSTMAIVPGARDTFFIVGAKDIEGAGTSGCKNGNVSHRSKGGNRGYGSCP